MNAYAKSAWEQAYSEHRRVFYEPATETIRSCPENYCLAYRVNGRWEFYPDEGMTRQFQPMIQLLIAGADHTLTGEDLAILIGRRLPRTIRLRVQS